jgi:hypothetical protein
MRHWRIVVDGVLEVVDRFKPSVAKSTKPAARAKTVTRQFSRERPPKRNGRPPGKKPLSLIAQEARLVANLVHSFGGRELHKAGWGHGFAAGTHGGFGVEPILTVDGYLDRSWTAP